MGTRGSYGFRCNDKLFVTYNHWDSDPEGLGEEIVNFCKSVKNEEWESIKAKVSKLKVVNSDDLASPAVTKFYTEKGFCDTRVSTGIKNEYYCLLRKLQGVKYLEEIVAGNVKHLINAENFLADSLFCEYAYIINLDTMSLDLYSGFNRQADKNTNLPSIAQTKCEHGYYPVRYVRSFPLSDIPENWKLDFYKSKNSNV